MYRIVCLFLCAILGARSVQAYELPTFNGTTTEEVRWRYLGSFAPEGGFSSSLGRIDPLAPELVVRPEQRFNLPRTIFSQLVAYTIKRNLLQAEGRSVAETPAWRARFDPKQEKKVWSYITAPLCRGRPPRSEACF